MKSRLSHDSRRADLAAMSDAQGLDVLVIGGGVTGAGVALDAATRGLRTGIVEAQDWASGTSSRSSKLVHGGLRYLQMLDFRLVREALTERDLLITELAPHLVEPLSFLYPLEHRVWERAYVGTGVALYDTLATVNGRRRRALPVHRHLGRAAMSKKFPDLRHDAAIGAIRYWDAAVDDARLVLTLVRTAASYGALTSNRTQVVSLTRSSVGAVNGAVVEDLETGHRHTIGARHVINATGVWTEQTEALAHTDGGLQVLASKGVHIVVPRDIIRGDVGLILQTATSVLFVIPWSRYWIIGTTDTPYDFDPTHPVATSQDIDYLLEQANAVLANPLTREDIIGTYAGLRPLLQPGTKEGTSSTKVSREHTVASPTQGLTVVAGGKLTTYRVMAKDAVDFTLGTQAKVLPSITDRIPLWGAEGLKAVKRQGPAIIARYGWTRATFDHLIHRYGSGISQILDAIDLHDDLALPLTHAPAYLRAEVHFAATHEQVMHLEDVMMHRTRLVYEAPRSGLDAVPEVAAITASVLGWDDARVAREIASYGARVEADAAAARAPSDVLAIAARAAAGDIAPMVALDQDASPRADEGNHP